MASIADDGYGKSGQKKYSQAIVVGEICVAEFEGDVKVVVVVVKLEAVLVVVCGTCVPLGVLLCVERGTWIWYHVPRTICAWYLTMQLAIKYILLSFLFFLSAYRSTDTFLSCVNLVAHAVGRLLIDLDESFLFFPLLPSASLLPFVCI